MNPEEQAKLLRDIRQVLEQRPSTQIMLVEDNEVDAELTIMRFEYFGLEVVWIPTAEAALERLKEGGSWIIFLDLVLPGMSGIVFLERLKECESPHKVIVLTGLNSVAGSLCQQALGLGALAVILKPITREQIKLIFGRV